MSRFSLIWLLALLSCSPSPTQKNVYSIPELSFYLSTDANSVVCQSVSAGSLHGYIILLDKGVSCESNPSSVKRYISVNAHYNSSELPKLIADFGDACTNQEISTGNFRNLYLGNSVFCVKELVDSIDYYVAATKSSDKLVYSDIIYYFNLHTQSGHVSTDLSKFERVFSSFRTEDGRIRSNY